MAKTNIATAVFCLLLLSNGFLVLQTSAGLSALDDVINGAAAEAAASTFQQFKLAQNKSYPSPAVEALSKDSFNTNFQFITEHNAQFSSGKANYSVGLNSFSDLSSEQFEQIYLNTKISKNDNSSFISINQAAPSNSKAAVTLPLSFDWRNYGIIKAVGNQGLCASSWAYAVTGCLETQYYFKYKRFVPLSEQNLVDCISKYYPSFGCAGASVYSGFNYVYMNRGINSAYAYPANPYTAPYGWKGTCNYKSQDSYYYPQASVSALYTITNYDEYLLQYYLYTVGPIAVTIDGSRPGFQYYKSGVYSDATCSPTNLNLAVLLVGWGYDSKYGPYWIVKNNWGTSWGQNGYIYMARNRNQCGIATVPLFAIM